ncbi:MAG: hypothetical protein JNK64_15910 [Myxococcales bacterium]|nr:hypothetical protein [Myxococcales bacterium]
MVNPSDPVPARALPGLDRARRASTHLLCALPLVAAACGPILKGAPKSSALLTVVHTTEEALPKPAAPPAEMVSVGFVPSPTEGESTVVVNVKDAEAKVSLVTSTKRAAVNVEGKGAVAGGAVQAVDLDTKLLCARTPCAFLLPYGSATLHLEAPPGDGWDSSTDLYDVDVVPQQAQLVTHLMSRTKTTTKRKAKESKGLVADILLESFGWTGITVGVPLALVSDDTRGAGIGLTVAGALMVGLGVALYDPGATQEDVHSFRPSATTMSPYPPR